MRDKQQHELEAYVVSPHFSTNGRWVRAHAAPVIDDNGEVIGGVTVFSDITERLRLPRQRDCLTAVIAHDIKNHLDAEQIFLDCLLMDVEKFDVRLQKLLNDLRAASNRYLGIADSLLEMSRSRFLDTNQYGQDVEVATLLDQSIKLKNVTTDRLLGCISGFQHI